MPSPMGQDRATPARAALRASVLGFGLLAGSAAPAAAQAAGDTALALQHWSHVEGRWEIQDQNRDLVGTITFGVGTAIGAQMELPQGGQLFASTRRLGDEAIELNLFAGIGDLSPGRILLSEHRPDPYQVLQGTIIKNGVWTVVTLIRLDTEAGAEALGDLPGVGVSGPPYRLRNVPPDGWVRVHDTARVTSDRFDRRMWREAEDILVLRCAPEVDTMAFEEADLAGKRAMLDRVWCEVDHADPNGTFARGWVRGSQLEPMAERMGWTR